MGKITLRNKSHVADPRLGRLKAFDERSRNFPVRRLVRLKKPRSYTWRCSKVLNQGQEGACVGAACAHELIARPVEVLEITMNYAKKKIYWEAQKIDQWPGGAYPGAQPFGEGTSVLAGAKTLITLGWCESYQWAFGLNDLILGVGYCGPCVVGTNWYRDMFDTDDDGFVHPTGGIVGGHAWLVIGVDVKRKQLRARNSWGKQWGMKGDFFITFDDMARLLKQQGEAVFMINRKRKPRS